MTKFNQSDTPPNEEIDISENRRMLMVLALQDAIAAYYKTYSAIYTSEREHFYKMVNYLPKKEANDEYLYGGYLYDEPQYWSNYLRTILGFAHFFELLLKDGMNIETKIRNEKQESSRTLDSLLKEIMTKKDEVQKILPPHLHYLAASNNIKAIDKLRLLRNSIQHDGKKGLTVLDLDRLVSQDLIPIIRPLIDTFSEYEREKINPTVECGINILEEMGNLKFPKNPKEFNHRYKYLCQLKELGKAGIHKPLNLPKSKLKDNPKFFKAFDTKQEINLPPEVKPPVIIPKKIKLQMPPKFQKGTIVRVFGYDQGKNWELFADVIAADISSPKILVDCPCCGFKTAIVQCCNPFIGDDGETCYYEKFDTIKCCFCGYSISDEINDPFEFGIISSPVFKAIKYN